MAKFKLKQDLPLTTQREIDRVIAIPSGRRTTGEASFLTALTPYLHNEVITYDKDGLITAAAGITLPTGDSGFRKGALFTDKDVPGNGLYINVGDEDSANWELSGGGGTGGSVTKSVATADSGFTADYYTDGENDEVQIQEAIDAVTSDGGTVLLRIGTYTIEEGIVMKSNVRLTGEGHGTVLYGSGTGFAIIEGFGTVGNEITDVEVSNLKIDGTGLVDASYNWFSKGIHMLSLFRARFINLYIYNTPATGLGTDFLVDSVIHNCIVDSCGRQYPGGTDGANGIGIGTGRYEAETLVISNCIAVNNGNIGIMFEEQLPVDVQAGHMLVDGCISYGNRIGFRNAGSFGVRFNNCSAFDNAGNGVDFIVHGSKYPRESIVSNCNIENNTTTGIYIITPHANVHEFQFIGNQIKDSGDYGIDIRGGSNIIVSNNIISGSGLDGVKILANNAVPNNNITITDNTVFNSGQKNTANSENGIKLTQLSPGAVNNLTITNNRVFDSQGTKTQEYGIQISVAAATSLNEVLITNNNLNGNNTAPLLLGNAVGVRVKDNLGVDDSVTKTAAYTAKAEDNVILCNATSAAFTVTLLAAARMKNQRYTIKKTDSSGNAVTIDGNASETIDGATTKVLSSQYEKVEIICDGSNWHIIG